MSAVLGWFRLDMRRRWRSLVVLALLVGVAAGAVMTTTAGARRAASAVDRLLAQTVPGTVVVQANQPGFDWDLVRALPRVAALAEIALTDEYVIEEIPRESFVARYPTFGDDAFRTIERPVVLDGRMLNPDRVDEVVVGPTFRDNFGLGVGDMLTLRLYTPETMDELAFADATAVEPDGPTVEARIVGVVRSPGQLLSGDEGPGAEGGVLVSPQLFEDYQANFMGASGEGIVNAIVRLHGGEDAIPEFSAALTDLTGRTDIGLWNLAQEARHAADVTAFEADALMVFAFVAGLAAVFLVGQVVVRYAASTVADNSVLPALGMSPRQSLSAAAVGPTIAAAAGSTVAVAGAAVASRWFPIGTASMFEPAPGFDFDGPVLVTGAIAVPALVGVGAVGAAWVALRATPARSSGRSPHRSSVVAAAARAGAPMPVVVGARFALEPGRGASAVPVRPALVGAVVGVLGVLAAFTFAAGIRDAADHPERFGQVHHLEAFVGFEGQDFGPVSQLLGAVAADPEVRSVDDARIGVATTQDVAVTLYTLDSVGIRWEPVLVEGRAPEGSAEIALAPRSARAIGVAVGDVISMTGTLRAHDLTVSGLAFVPEFPSHNDYASGGWVTADAYDSLFDPDSDVSPAYRFRLLFVAVDGDADTTAVATRLEEATGVGFQPPDEPTPVAELRQVGFIPAFLAGFLAVLALAAIGHALTMAVRRRRHDIAVLRALGMTRRQVRGVVMTQASVLAVVGLLIGIPLGVALGRVVWRYVADTTPLLYVPPMAVAALILVPPAVVLASSALSTWPGHRASTIGIGPVLRAE